MRSPDSGGNTPPRHPFQQAQRFTQRDVSPALEYDQILTHRLHRLRHYAMFAQGGPRSIAVSSLPLSFTLLGGMPESVPDFADVELVETEEAGFFFGNETDDRGIRWASRLQTWLELQSGDARQQDAAKDLRDQILRELKA